MLLKGEYLAEMKGARVYLCSPLTYTVCQPPAYRGESKGGGGLCIMYFYSLPCLNFYVDSANPDLMCESVCVCVCACTSSAMTSEVIIYVYTTVACASGCCMVLYRKTVCKKSPCTRLC